MILETDEETRDFVTIYKKDFHPKRGKKTLKCVQPANYYPPLNALNGPFHEYLNSMRKNDRVPIEDRTEDPRDNLEKIRSRFPHLHKFLPEKTPDENVIESEQKKAFKTIYQLEYSKHIDDYLSLHARRTGGDRKAATLPSDWIIPETIQRRSYRNPRDLATADDLARGRKIGKPANNLDPNAKEREILRIATGNSEYGNVIGATGDRIFREQLHGVPLPLDPPSPRVKGPDSIRSECSDVLAAPKAPFISYVL